MTPKNSPRAAELHHPDGDYGLRFTPDHNGRTVRVSGMAPDHTYNDHRLTMLSDDSEDVTVEAARERFRECQRNGWKRIF